MKKYNFTLLLFTFLLFAGLQEVSGQCDNPALTPTGVTASPVYVCEGSANPTFTGACSGNCNLPVLYDNATWDVSITVTVCHSWMSDLEQWYLITPSGGQIALDLTGPSASGSSWSLSSCGPYGGGTDRSMTVTFTSTVAASPGWTGNNQTEGIQAGESALNGLNVNAAGWGVQVYDCVNFDNGAITGASITFSGPSTVTYSLSTAAIINDNACAAGTAAIVTVPPAVTPRAGWYADATGGSPLNASGSTYTPVDAAPGTYDYYTQCICGTGDCPTTRTQVDLIIVDKAPAFTIQAVCNGSGTVDVSLISALPAPVNGTWEYSFNGGAYSTTATSTVAPGSGTVTVSVRNSLLTSCATSASVAVPATCIICPVSPPAVSNDNGAVCDGGGTDDFTTWQATMASNVAAVDNASSVSTVEYSTALPTSAVPATGNTTVTGDIAAGCANVNQVINAYMRCDNGTAGVLTDDTWTLIGTYTLTVYPAVQAPTIVTSGCSVTVTGACATDVVTLVGASGLISNNVSNSATFTALPGSAASTFNISVSTGIAGSTCAAYTATQATPVCSESNISLSDPCVCNSDFTGGTSGTFSDEITITTTPAVTGLNWSASICTGCTINSTLDNADGTYTVSLTFANGVAYTYTADCSASGASCTDAPVSLSGGNCAYKDGALFTCTPFCDNETSATLNAFPTGGTWSANAPGGILNPSVAGVGTHAVTYTYNTFGTACPRVLSTNVVVENCCEIAIVSSCASACTWNGTSSEYTVDLTVSYAGLPAAGDNLQLQLGAVNQGAPVAVTGSEGLTTFTVTLPADGAVDAFTVLGTSCSSAIYNVTAPANCPPPACAPNAAGTFGTGN